MNSNLIINIPNCNYPFLYKINKIIGITLNQVIDRRNHKIGKLFIPYYKKQNQEMMHMHNQSTLLGSKRRAVYYPPTGTGRDTYIMTDNGGTNITYKLQGVPELGNYMKFGPTNRSYKPCSYNRSQKYVSDGTGRDQYVVSHHGGQYNEEDQCNLLLRKFRDTMRDGGWKKNQTGQSWRVTKQARRERAMSQYQNSQGSRLSAPKRVSEKYLSKLDQLRKTFYPNIQ